MPILAEIVNFLLTELGKIDYDIKPKGALDWKSTQIPTLLQLLFLLRAAEAVWHQIQRNRDYAFWERAF